MNNTKNDPIVELAPAKINLYLHVTGQRADGYHTLDSLVVFAHEGGQASDTVTLAPSDAYMLRLSGPQAVFLENEPPQNNLVTKALRILASKIGRVPHFDVWLCKNLPVASGIGGGSSDAAAALRAAARYWELPENHEAVIATAKETGADVLACLINKPCFMGGIGDEIEAIERIPSCFMVLVNPNIPLPTEHVFKARKGPFREAGRLTPIPETLEDFYAALAARGNDLQAPAALLCEAITDVLAVLNAQAGCMLARLSGSGATCFGLFEKREDAEKAAATIRRQIREWWVAVSGF